MIITGVLLAILGILVVLSIRSITTLLHELGHAIPSLLFAEGEVVVYVGSYGDITKSLKIQIGRLKLYLKFNILDWNLGMCVHQRTTQPRWQMLVIVLGGPFISLLLASVLMYLLVFIAMNVFLKALCLLFFFSSIWDFFINIIPNQQAIKLHDGMLCYNDGYQLKMLLAEGPLPDAYFKGLELYHASDFDAALETFYQIFEEGFDKKILKERILDCHIQLKQNQTALDFFLEEMAIRKLKVHEYETLGDLFFNVEDYKNAVKCYSEFLYVHYRNANVISKKGQALFHLGEYSLAMKELDIALRMNDRLALAYAFRGRLFVHMQDWEMAKSDLTTALQLEDHHQIHLHLGLYYERRSENELALYHFEKAKALGNTFHGLDYKMEEVRQEIERKNY
ncbi:MAG: hypothetical protein R2828_13655 [Saprospiraceae bacterium]